MVLLWHGDAVLIVPNGHQQWHLQHTSGIDSLVEHALRGTCIADGAKGDLVAIIREFTHLAQVLILPEELGCIG